MSPESLLEKITQASGEPVALVVHRNPDTRHRIGDILEKELKYPAAYMATDMEDAAHVVFGSLPAPDRLGLAIIQADNIADGIATARMLRKDIPKVAIIFVASEPPEADEAAALRKLSSHIWVSAGASDGSFALKAIEAIGGPR